MDLWNYKIKPMLAYLSKPFNSKNHIFEIKFDGIRGIGYIDTKEGSIRLLNRRFIWFEYRYPELKEILNQINAERVILDGEVVVFEKGLPNFNLLQEREQVEDKYRIEMLSKLYSATYVVFDILYLDGKNLTKIPLIERKKILEKVVSPSKRIMISEFFEEKGIEIFKSVKELGLEGIMAKHKFSKYYIGKRSKAWLKIKNLKTIDAIICGYTKGKGKRENSFGALLLGVYDNGKLRYIGRVGTGEWSEEFLVEFRKKLDEIKIDYNPFDIFNERKEIVEIANFVKPIYVAEIEFLELTKDKKLRAPSFKRLRNDKDPKDCKLEEIREVLI